VTLNLGNGDGFSNREVVAAATAVVGREIAVEVGPRRAGDPPILVASATRAREVLGWEPRRSSLGSMIGSAWAWRQAHPDGYPD
jgi:UDP-glucose 4-epimerase